SIDVIQRYADWARALYPGPGALNTMGSAAMSEAHVATALARTGSLIGMLAEVGDAQAVRALSLLTAGAEHRPEFARYLGEALRVARARLLPLAVAAVPAAHPAGPLVAAMTEVLPDLSGDALDAVAAALPKRSLTLGPFALRCEELAWARHREADDRLAAGRF